MRTGAVEAPGVVERGAPRSGGDEGVGVCVGILLVWGFEIGEFGLGKSRSDFLK